MTLHIFLIIVLVLLVLENCVELREEWYLERSRVISP